MTGPSHAEVAAVFEEHWLYFDSCRCGWKPTGPNPTRELRAHLADVVAQVYAGVVEAVERVEAPPRELTLRDAARVIKKALAGTSQHQYTSTACHHDRHDDCRLECKFCEQPCRCECHQEDE